MLQWSTGLTTIHFNGNAPTLGSSDVFYLVPATIYYLPGTTGWGTHLGGLPTLLWNPTVARDASFGFEANRFGFDVSGTTNIPIIVEASTNLSSGVWTPLTNTTLGTSGSIHFYDPSSSTIPTRFYRIVWP